METEGDGVVDPLANYWGLSLFLSASIPPSKPHNHHQDLHSIHTHLTSMALRSPVKLMEQSKSILDENPELFNPEISTDPTSEVVVDEDLLRQRRPALGLKRARFSLKPTKGPSVESLLPTLDIDNLKDPVEFFLAHERLENAKRELQKQLGGGLSEDNASNKPRKRRPGLLGNANLSIKYKHRYPTVTSDNKEYVPSSQETFESESLDPVVENTVKDGASLTSMENEAMDSSAIEENKLNDILEGLLSCNSEDLEGDGAITLLQKRLEIKPIVLEKSSVPDFPDNQVIDLKSLQAKSSKPRKPLSDIHNLLKGMNNKTPLRLNARSPLQQLASPTPPRSPFASFSTLQKHIWQSKQSVDPFSAHEVDHLSTGNHSPTNTINPELNLAASGKPSNERNAHMIEDVIAIGKMSAISDTDRNCDSTSEKSKENNSGKSSSKLNKRPTEDIIAADGTSLAEDTVRNEPHADMDVDIGSSGMSERVMDVTIDRSKIEANKSCQSEDKAENTQAFTASMPTGDTNSNLVNPVADRSISAGYQADGMDECARRSDDGPEHCLQEKTDGSMVPVNGQKRVKLRSRRESKNKGLVRRESLAAAGTSWNSGIRRSTRIRTRPLEYWKGERLVYGRVHESLATVIGVKRMSPGTDGKPTMKVKSYVSDKYKELLELASLY